MKKGKAMFEPTEEQQRAYIEAQQNKNPMLIWPLAALADLALHAMAAALEAEHKIICLECQHFDWTKADWLRLADEKLREVKR